MTNMDLRSAQELISRADAILDQAGFTPDGKTKKNRTSRAQCFFERRKLLTPMGNRSR